MAFIVVICVLIAIPLIICCYLGVGIGTTCRKIPLPTVVPGLPTTTITNDVTADTNMDYSAANAPSLYSQPPSVPYPATRFPPENPCPYPLQPPGEYPLQQHAGYPAEGYPPQQYATYRHEGYPSQQYAGYRHEGYPFQQPALYPPEEYPP